VEKEWKRGIENINPAIACEYVGVHRPDVMTMLRDVKD
jgi:hypothetical protein